MRCSPGNTYIFLYQQRPSVKGINSDSTAQGIADKDAFPLYPISWVPASVFILPQISQWPFTTPRIYSAHIFHPLKMNLFSGG